MKIRFSNPFLAICGTIWAIISMFSHTIWPSFFFGLCFGLIYLNYKDDKNANN